MKLQTQNTTIVIQDKCMIIYKKQFNFFRNFLNVANDIIAWSYVSCDTGEVKSLVISQLTTTKM